MSDPQALCRPSDAQAAAARALSERWNRRQGKCIYPSNSTPEDWLESGDAQAATAAVLREVPYETEYELAEEIKWLRQGLWDVAALAGVDTDGDATPDYMVYPDIVKWALDAVRGLREDYDHA